MEEDFPRGKEGITPLAQKNTRTELFKPSILKKAKKRKVLTGEEEEVLAGKKKTPKSRDFLINHLSYDSLCAGMLMMGRVVLVREHEVLVSLPGRTIGSVSIKSISRPYTTALHCLESSTFPKDEVMHALKGMFRTGDVVIVKVLSVTEGEDGLHRVTLSTDPAETQANWNPTLIQIGMVLTGAVHSREEHGYIMDMGMNGVKAFLPHDRASAFIKKVNDSEPIGVGQLLQVKVVSCKIHRLMATITLSAIPHEVAKVKIEDEMGLNYTTLLPGMLVDAIVMDTHKTGMQVHVNGLKGLVHQDHLDDDWSTPSKYDIGSTVIGRILYLEPNGSSPYLTLQPSLWPYGPFRQTKKANIIILGGLEKVRIVRFEKRGLIIRFESGEKGIVPLQRCSDNMSWTEDDVAKNFPVGTFHDCRVLEFSIMDQVYIGSFQKTLLDQDLVKIDQVSAGDKVSVEIHLWNTGGAVVLFGHRLKGFVPNMHFAETSKKLSDKHPIGSELKGRVFAVDKEKSQVIITVKKPLVKSKGDVITSYEQASKGMIGHGVIRQVLPAGLQISTLGGLLGFLPASKITKEKLTSLDTLFHIGQVVEFKVVEVNVKRSQLILKLWTGAEEEEEEEEVVKVDSEKPAKKKSKKSTIKETTESESPEEVVVTEVKKKKRKRNKKKKKSKEEEKKTDDIAEDIVAEDVAKKSSKSKKKDQGAAVLTKHDKQTLVDKKLTKKAKSVEKVEEKEEKSVEKVVEKKKKKKAKKSSAEESTKKEGDEEVAPLEATLPLKESSFWGVPANKEDEEDDEEEDSNEKEVRRKKQQETEVSSIAALSLDEHERRVTVKPNEPSLWIDYMNFAIDSGDLNKAREVGHRAVETVAYRDESAKLRVWSALLSLECKYGSEESLKKELAEAERRNDKFSVMKNMALILDNAGKQEETEKIYTRMVRSFRSTMEAWQRFGIFYYRHGNIMEGRKLFSRALDALPEPEQIKLSTRFAGLEMEMGEKAKGCEMLDNILLFHPKRMDLWVLYANALIKAQQYDQARGVLDRGLKVKLAPKKVKPLLKLYMELEQNHGTSETMEEFKAKAVDYLEQVQLSFPA